MTSMWSAFNAADGVSPATKRDDKISPFQKSWVCALVTSDEDVIERAKRESPER